MKEEDNILSSLTVSLLEYIGSPFQVKKITRTTNKSIILNLYQHSIKNRMPLFFLHELEHKREFGLDDEYSSQYKRYLNIFDAMVKFSDYLSNKEIEHAIFKSIKPFPDASVDIDTIIFSDEKYSSLLKVFSKDGWKLLGYGPQSATYYDMDSSVGIDLYRDVSVSWVAYLDKEKFREQIVKKKLPNDKYVYSLTLEADLLATIAHSVIKEQLYTIAEFYTFTRWINLMSTDQITKFCHLTEKNNLVQAVKSFITISCLIHRRVFLSIPERLVSLLEYFGIEPLEEQILKKRNYDTPHKYHAFTVSKSIIEKTRERKSKNSFAFQFYNMLRPKFALSVIWGFLEHMLRQTY